MQYFEAHPVTYYKDADGKTPEILLIDGNRTGGKTTGISKMLVEDFLNNGKKFFLVYRYKNDLKDVAEAFFKDIKFLFFPEHEMIAKGHANGAFYELYIDKKPCGYASSLTMAGKLKRYSHVFNDVQSMFFDEYQDENGLYLPSEVEKLMSLHTTIARGHGQPVRFVPVYMCSNSISIFNPYYLALGISGKINSNTRVFRGSGFVLLRLTIKNVAEAQKQSAFNRAFSNAAYFNSSIDNSFLNDDSFNVERRKTTGSPILVFVYNKELFSIYGDTAEAYVKKGGDETQAKFGVLETDRGGGIVSIRSSRYLFYFRSMFQDSNVYFETQEAKRAFQALITC